MVPQDAPIEGEDGEVRTADDGLVLGRKGEGIGKRLLDANHVGQLGIRPLLERGRRISADGQGRVGVAVVPYVSVQVVLEAGLPQGRVYWVPARSWGPRYFQFRPSASSTSNSRSLRRGEREVL